MSKSRKISAHIIGEYSYYHILWICKNKRYLSQIIHAITCHNHIFQEDKKYFLVFLLLSDLSDKSNISFCRLSIFDANIEVHIIHFAMQKFPYNALSRNNGTNSFWGHLKVETKCTYYCLYLFIDFLKYRITDFKQTLYWPAE